MCFPKYVLKSFLKLVLAKNGMISGDGGLGMSNPCFLHSPAIHFWALDLYGSSMCFASLSKVYSCSFVVFGPQYFLHVVNLASEFEPMSMISILHRKMYCSVDSA